MDDLDFPESHPLLRTFCTVHSDDLHSMTLRRNLTCVREESRRSQELLTVIRLLKLTVKNT